jgi:putative nucleotidyltransferase with HDIG domain
VATVNTLWIDTQQLRAGLHVYLDLSWFDHPFPFSHFKITSDDQIRTIRSLGLTRVRYSPELSDEPVALAVAARPAAPPATESAAPAPAPPESASPMMKAKEAMVQRARERRLAAERVEKAFVATARTLKDLQRNMFSRPAEALAVTQGLVSDIADAILTAPEMAIQVMAEKPGGEELYLHSLNVATLSLMVARDLKLPRVVAEALGVGALLHDMGEHEVPDRILHKRTPLTPAERHFFEQHPVYGVTMARKLALAPMALAVIGQHHEFFDGSGYPAGLKGDQIELAARIVVITNHFDELCNPASIDDAMTPHEALSLMFARQQAKFDPRLLKVFIRCMGVYPPGSIVQLSNGALGIVSSVNTDHPMRPVVLIYDESVPPEAGMMIELEAEPSLNISKAIRPAQLPREVLKYLSPRMHLSYYFDTSPSSSGKASP